MDFEEACRIIMNQSGFGCQLGTSVTGCGTTSSTYDYGRFYGNDLKEIGAGQIYNNIRYPVFDKEDLLFNTAAGQALILSHECDIAQDNQRPFNEMALLCPIMRLESFTDTFNGYMTQEKIRSFFCALGKDTIYRLLFLPPIPDSMPYGGVIYLNQITHTHIDAFHQKEVHLAGTVSSYGLNIIDYKVTNHLLRPKSSHLSNI